MRTLIYVMSNDAKWMEKDVNLPFVPNPGSDLDGLVDEQSLRVNGASYNVDEDFLKLRMSWLSPDPLDSKELVSMGWKLK